MKGSQNGKAIAYLHGYFAAKIEAYAPSTGLSADELAGRLGALLLGAPDGQILGTVDPVPSLRGATAAGDKAARKVAVARVSHSGAPGRGSGAKGYWAKMTKAERSAEMRRRVDARRDNEARSKMKAA